MRLIPNFPGYQIAKDGRVWSEPKLHHKGKWLKTSTHSFGYMQVVLRKGDKYYTRTIHRLLLETYIGPRPKGMECRHLNGNPIDNKLENLKWGTRSENMLDAVKHGTSRLCNQTGEQNNRAKLTENEVRLIFDTYHDGVYNQYELANFLA